MSVEIWFHIVAMGVYSMLILPIVLFVHHTTLTHQALHAVGLALVVLGIGVGIGRPFSYASAVHTLGGFAFALALIGVAFMGTMPAQRKRGFHVVVGRALLYVALPFELFTGVIVALELNERSGMRESVMAALAALVFAAIGAAYAVLSPRVKRSTGMPELLRAYSLLATENVGVIVVGLGALSYTLYIEQPAVPALIAHVASSFVVMFTGLGVFLSVRRRALDARLVHVAVAQGVPVAVLTFAVAIIVVAWPVRPSEYARTAAAVTAGALTLAAIARLARATACMALPLGVVATSAFVTQRGFESFFVMLTGPPWWPRACCWAYCCTCVLALRQRSRPQAHRRRRRDAVA
jgi:uncharacterized membrane protein (DUF485 family)